jgi:putative ABC transport system ATP-binding protein
MTGGPILVAERLRKAYHISATPHVVIKEVNLKVERGEFVAIMGPSGCGKSTLLHLLGGLERPDEGRVFLDGVELTALDEERLTLFRRERIGFVFQFFNLLPSLTAAENVALPLRIAGSRDKQVFKRVDVLMDTLNLRGLQGHRPEEISGGEQQRVALARALLMDPAVLMADEPTGNLDYTTGREVLDLLTAFSAEQHQTIILVTHDAKTAAYADRVLCMRDGAVLDEVILGRRTEHNAAPLISRLSQLGL